MINALLDVILKQYAMRTLTILYIIHFIIYESGDFFMAVNFLVRLMK